LTEYDELCIHILNATTNVEQDYNRVLKAVETLKQKMIQLEQIISQKKPEETAEDMNSLRHAIKSLDKITDSQILKSKEAWKKYDELKHDCEVQTLKPPQLDELRIRCKKTEQLAVDLLCYSLGFVKQKTSENK